ncbi:CHAD domain-containing protein [Pseudomonas sp. LTJR-52]|uniref:CHAD domain-containing protein n=1 Tax=Pseudomonas sp. LTJR-52 TaxID=2479392 RepID=UPI000EFC18D6|nr:CHAD domain-containing protein [Pseudomonas sp. LTJR-52]AYN92984.1 CHAD domain-containing protein [Pseudomonas sp. LTJR-52]
MSFRIQARKRVDDEIRRVVVERIEKAQESLSAGSAKGVHNARKRLKEIRAVLRLVREPLGKKIFTAQNIRFRDLGQGLSSLRDAAAVIESWDALTETNRKRFNSPAMKRVRGRLVERAEKASQGEAASSHADLVEALEDAKYKVSTWKFKGKDFGLLESGILKTYTDGRLALKVARSNATDETLHEWRKRVKDHWYHTQLLMDAWPEHFKSRQKCLEKLSAYLGDDHDLAVMQLLLEQESDLFGAVSTRQAINESILAHRAQLQAKAMELGQRIYVDKPAALLEHWEKLWNITAMPSKAKKAKKHEPAGLLPYLVEPVTA